MSRERKAPCKYDWAERSGWIYDTGSSSTKAKVYGDINLILVCKLHNMSHKEYLEGMYKDDLLSGNLLKYYLTLE